LGKAIMYHKLSIFISILCFFRLSFGSVVPYDKQSSSQNLTVGAASGRTLYSRQSSSSSSLMHVGPTSRRTHFYVGGFPNKVVVPNQVGLGATTREPNRDMSKVPFSKREVDKFFEESLTADVKPSVKGHVSGVSARERSLSFSSLGSNDYGDDDSLSPYDKNGDMFDVDGPLQSFESLDLDEFFNGLFPFRQLAPHAVASDKSLSSRSKSSDDDFTDFNDQEKTEDLFVDESSEKFIGPRQEHQGPPLSFKAQAAAKFDKIKESLSSGARKAGSTVVQGVNGTQQAVHDFLEYIKFDTLDPNTQKAILTVLVALIGLGIAGAARPSDFVNGFQDVLKILLVPQEQTKDPT